MSSVFQPLFSSGEDIDPDQIFDFFQAARKRRERALKPEKSRQIDSLANKTRNHGGSQVNNGGNLPGKTQFWIKPPETLP
jgi:hypothetical protein